MSAFLSCSNRFYNTTTACTDFSIYISKSTGKSVRHARKIHTRCTTTHARQSLLRTAPGKNHIIYTPNIDTLENNTLRCRYTSPPKHMAMKNTNTNTHTLKITHNTLYKTNYQVLRTVPGKNHIIFTPNIDTLENNTLRCRYTSPRKHMTMKNANTNTHTLKITHNTFCTKKHTTQLKIN